MKLFASVVFVFACMVVAGVVPLAQSGKETAEQLAARVQARYDTIRDFEADFVQTYQGGLLRTKATEQGTVAIKRPGRMRWIYTKPERKEFVSNGRQIYSYVPRDKQVIVSPMPEGEQTTPALFLTGRGHLVRDFHAEFTDVPGAAPGTLGLKLVPKKTDPEFEWLMIAIDASTLQLQQLVALDRQGGQSSFTFTNLKENRNLSDKIFDFQIPRGVDVITNGVVAKK
ncbi:MAG TPA: outer membrane lipoprotein chaperone LolA [Vicinamibacterales bacterium]|nr:outer membrane lipoprotein chaperone LolA [Vicinamibacterales bacterium]